MNIEYLKGNIADIVADAVVVPSNPYLIKGPGASQAIFQAAGENMLEHACRSLHPDLDPLDPGNVALTPAFRMNAACLIFASVPKWSGGKSGEYENLARCYLNALYLADSGGCESIAFPLLGSGNNGFDPDLSFLAARQSFVQFARTSPEHLKKILVVLYDENAVQNAVNNGIYVKNLKPDLPVHKAPVIDWQDLVRQGMNWMGQEENQRMIRRMAGVVMDILEKKAGFR